jgi:hypothetical protein
MQHSLQTIRKKLLIEGEYYGETCKLYTTGMDRLMFGIQHVSRQFGESVELYSDFDEAVCDFLALEARLE